jgi:hypothetical protein
MNLYKLAIGITNTLEKDKDTINKDKLKYDIYKKIKNLNIRKSNNNVVNNYYYKGNGNDDNEVEEEEEKFNDVMNQVKDDLNDIDKDIFKSYHN